MLQNLATPAAACDDHAANVIPLRVPDPAVYEELATLATGFPLNYRCVFELRFGERIHTLAEIAEIVGSKPGNVRSQLEVCLWNCHRMAVHADPPAIRRMLGPDRRQWTARAWSQAARWEQTAARIAETRLLLAIGGMDVPQIQQVIGQYLVTSRVLDVNPWGDPLTRRQRAEQARPIVDRILEHRIKFDTPAGAWTPESFEPKRTLGSNWIGQGGRGYFYSQRFDRPVAYESLLEREMLRHLEADHRVSDICEQPFTIPAIYGGSQHMYTPDIAVRMNDGTVVVIEVKGPVRLAEWGHWMRWVALARVCELSGWEMYIGAPEHSILDHHIASERSQHRHLVHVLADEGAATGSDNRVSLQEEDQVRIAEAVTAEVLAWQPGAKGGIHKPSGLDLEKARGFWGLVAANAR